MKKATDKKKDNYNPGSCFNCKYSKKEGDRYKCKVFSVFVHKDTNCYEHMKDSVNRK